MGASCSPESSGYEAISKATRPESNRVHSMGRKISDKTMRKLLAPPDESKWPIKVVFDTDANNEIDDQFALSWAINSPDRFNILGMYAAPFSFANYTHGLLEAYQISKIKPCDRTEQQQKLLDKYQLNIEKCEELKIDIPSLANDKHYDSGPKYGMETSYDKIIELYKVMKKQSEGIVFKGASQFMEDSETPVESEAVDHLIKTARACSTDDPLYIVCIACPTNTASAIVKAPDIVDKIVVTWDASFPTNVLHLKEQSLNMSEDYIASEILFTSDVPLVYLPGFYIAQQLSISYPDIKDLVANKGELGKFLATAFEKNPLYRLFGDNYKQPGFVWILWDIINVAWLYDPSIVSTYVHTAPILSKNDYWKPEPKNKLMREADNININQVWKYFYEVLDKQAKS